MRRLARTQLDAWPPRHDLTYARPAKTRLLGDDDVRFAAFVRPDDPSVAFDTTMAVTR